MLTRQDGKVYRGEFLLGRRHGCGAQVDLSAFYEEVARGTGAEEAWQRTREQVAATAERGTFRGDAFASGPVDEGDGEGARRSGFCTLAEVEGTVEEVEHLVARARMFEHKPDGAVSTSLTHDDSGAPAPLMQDPLHYPFGTKWMAPGPLGQCFRLPDDEGTLEALDAAAHNHELVWREFNLPRVIEPGTDLAAAVAHSERVVARARLREAEPHEKARVARRMIREGEAAAEEEARAAREREDRAAGKAPAGKGSRRPRERISDEDLVADASSSSSFGALASSAPGPGAPSASDGGGGGGSEGGRGSGGRGGSAFGSMTASLFARGGNRGGDGGNRSGENPAALLASALGRAAAAVASRVPVGGRRGLARPSCSFSAERE